VNRAGTLTYAALAAAGDMVSVTTVDEGAVCTAMLELYQHEGIIAEPAGALSVAALMETNQISPDTTVVCLISGGNNDVSRYGEILERSLVHLGLRHYFLVDFPQEPGALRRFLDEVLGPNDDITLFEYVKRSNRETGAALVGVELGSAEDLDGLLTRMRASDIDVEQLKPDSQAYRYLINP
jgi:threonine dehydratase